MANRPMGVHIEYERNEQGKTMWWVARMLTDQPDGTIRFESATPLRMVDFEFNPAMITSFSIEMIDEPYILAERFGGGLVGLLIAGIAKQWIKFPVVRLEQPEAEQGQQWIRVRGTGTPQRRQTRKIAERVSETLAASAYSGPMPDLSDDSMWRVPMAQIVIGFVMTAIGLIIAGLVVAVVFHFLF